MSKHNFQFFDTFIEEYKENTLKPSTYSVNKLNLGSNLYPFDLLLNPNPPETDEKAIGIQAIKSNPLYTKKAYSLFLNKDSYAGLTDLGRKYLFPYIASLNKFLLPHGLSHLEFDHNLLSDRLSVFINCIIIDDTLEKLRPSFYKEYYDAITKGLMKGCKYNGIFIIEDKLKV